MAMMGSLAVCEKALIIFSRLKNAVLQLLTSFLYDCFCMYPIHTYQWEDRRLGKGEFLFWTNCNGSYRYLGHYQKGGKIRTF